MECVNVLIRGYRVDYCLFVDMFWKGELNEYTVHSAVAVKYIHQVKELLLSCVFFERILERLESHSLASLLFIVHVDSRCRVVSDYYYCKTDFKSAFFPELCSFLCHLSLDCRRNFFSVYYLCHFLFLRIVIVICIV